MTYWIARKLAKVQHIGMVNILAENEIVPELLQQDFTPERLAEEAILLLKDQDRRATMIGHLKQIRSLLGGTGRVPTCGRDPCGSNQTSLIPA